MAPTGIGATRIPSLNTVQLQPQCERPASRAYAFLRNIESVDINRIEVIDGVPVYVIEIYFGMHQSQIPTVLRHKRSQQRSLRHTRDQAWRALTQRTRHPELIAKRSYAAFQNLLQEISCHLDRENRGRCHTCNEWMTFLTFVMPKSTLAMKILPISTLRKIELAKFIKAAVLLASQATVASSRRHRCAIGDSIAQTTSAFLQPHRAPY